MSNIQIETDKDRIVNAQTIPNLKINMDNIEIAADDSPTKPRIEIPERSSRAHDSDSSSDGHKSNTDFKFLINPKKFNPVAKEQVEPEVKKQDTDSEKSKKSTHSRRSKVSVSSEPRKDDSSEYKPRISTIGSNFKPFSTPGAFNADVGAPGASGASFMGTSFPTTRKSFEGMSEDEIRRRKSHYLEQYERKNKDYIYSPKRLSMKNDIEEILSELEYITNKRRKENMMDMWKRGLLLVVDGASVVNNYANDPFDIDLSDWSKEMHWDVYRAGKYDEVLEDLIDKYHQSKIPIAPEWKLAFMMGSSLVFGVVQKKQEKAKMKKRLEEERRMEEKVRNQVRDEIARMQYVPHQQQHTGQQNAFNRQQAPAEWSNPKRPATVVQPTVNQMSGPSLSDDKIMKLMEANFIDSTIALDSSSVSSNSTKSSKASTASKKSEAENPTVAPEKKKRGRPRKESVKPEEGKAELVTEMDKTEMSAADKVITLPAGRGGLSRRGGRGRPRKDVAVENAIVLDI